MTEQAVENVVYLDHAATSWPKPDEVAREMLRALTDVTANAGRSGHQPSVESARTVFQTREELAQLLRVSRSENLVFVRGCTEGLNLVIRGLLQPGNVVAVSPMEHNSVMRPLRRWAHEQGVVVETLAADPYGRIDLEAARRVAGRKKLALLAVCHASNVNGAVQDVRGLRAVFPETPLLVDAAQTAGVLPIHVEPEGIDFLACSVHKGLLGPTGVGVCYLNPRFEVRPLQHGGTGSRSESLEQPDFRPDRYESGTLNLHGIAGTHGALLGIAERGLLGDHKRQLAGLLLDEAGRIPGVRPHSPQDGTALCASLTVDGVRPDKVAALLEERWRVLCRPGLQCAPAAHRHLGTFPDGTVRLSPGWRNTIEDVEVALRGIHAIAKSA
ncbi:MAG: aminotransferase class V-fold PLP-dependent enzyme [Pirellulales bacterium]|nr:aminotransferase class V-fold PLP-dependent enzyme [Pirellulales bacterium]